MATERLGAGGMAVGAKTHFGKRSRPKPKRKNKSRQRRQK